MSEQDFPIRSVDEYRYARFLARKGFLTDAQADALASFCALVHALFAEMAREAEDTNA